MPVLKLFPYDGAQDSTRHPLLINPTDVVEADNIVYTTYSTKKKRPGILQAFDFRPSGSNPYLSGVDFHRQGTQNVVLYDGQNIKAINITDSTEQILTPPSGVVIPASVPVNFTVFGGFLAIFFDDNTTPPIYWTGSGSMQRLSDSVGKASFGMVFMNCLWINDPDVPGRILKSATGAPTNFTTNDAATYDLDSNDGDPDGITAIMPPMYGSLYVSKRLGIWKLTPVQASSSSLFFSVQKIVTNMGCLYHSACVAAEGTLFFASDRGVHYLENSDKISGVEAKYLSLPIQNEYRATANFERSKYFKMVYDFDLNSILLAYPESSRFYPTSVIGFSFAAAKWYSWRGFNQYSMFSYTDRASKKRKTLVCSATGDVGELTFDSSTDYGRPINIYIRGGLLIPSQNPKDSFNLQSVMAVFVPQSSGSFQITYKCDGRVVDTMDFEMNATISGSVLGEDFILGYSVLGGVPQVSFVNKEAAGDGTVYEFFIIHEPQENENVGFEILGLFLEARKTVGNQGKVSG